jgi:hypothetical protein
MRRTSKINFFFPTSSSRDHSVKRQNSVPTRQISLVRRHTTVGVPEKEISLSYSCQSRHFNMLLLPSRDRYYAR